MPKGEQIGKEKGRITCQRIIEVENTDRGPTIETNFSANAKFKGVDAVDTVTYWTIPSINGMSYSEVKGVIMTIDGSEVATFTAYGIGRLIDSGRVRLSGISHYSTRSVSKLAFFNNFAGIFEYESDGQGNISSRLWELR
jgi:hypothetical protein